MLLIKQLRIYFNFFYKLKSLYKKCAGSQQQQFEKAKQKMYSEYKCGCGRSYGSYPAFSTHRKTKHNNQTVPGTKIPTQDKAKRGRPSYDFKKIPKPQIQQKISFQGLTIIEYGLLDLQQIFKGRILSDPTVSVDCNSFTKIQELMDEQESESIIKGMYLFAKMFTNHLQRTIASNCVDFIVKLIKYGRKQGILNSINLYNNYFRMYSNQLKSSSYGLQFHMRICIIMAKWLQTTGYAAESIKIRQKSNSSISVLQ